MKVRSFWIENCPGAKIGQPFTFMSMTPMGMQKGEGGVVTTKDGDRALVKLETPLEWQTLEERGIGFSQFEDTED